MLRKVIGVNNVTAINNVKLCRSYKIHRVFYSLKDLIEIHVSMSCPLFSKHASYYHWDLFFLCVPIDIPEGCCLCRT